MFTTSPTTPTAAFAANVFALKYGVTAVQLAVAAVASNAVTGPRYDVSRSVAAVAAVAVTGCAPGTNFQAGRQGQYDAAELAVGSAVQPTSTNSCTSMRQVVPPGVTAVTDGCDSSTARRASDTVPPSCGR